MVLDRDKLKKLLKEKDVKSIDDFNAFMRDVSKDVVETLLEEELTDHLGFEKHDQKAKTIDNSRNGYTPKTVKSKFGEIDLSVPQIGDQSLSLRLSKSASGTSQALRKR
jgi:transposase-like protein